MIRRLVYLLVLVIAVFIAPGRATEVSGSWTVAISTADGTITGKASLKQDGERVTGWVGPSEADPIPVEGKLVGNKLTLKTLPQPGRTVAFDHCDVTVLGDKMRGAIDTDKGKIEFARSAP
jgi:hypothetical protein